MGQRVRTRERISLLMLPRPRSHRHLRKIIQQKTLSATTARRLVNERGNCPSYHAELKKRKNVSVTSTSGIFTIELYDFPNNTWVYDTGCGTHICNTSQGLRGSRKLKHRILSLYMGNGIRAAEASGSHGLLEMSRSDKGLEIIQEEDTQPYENTSKEHNEVAPIKVEPQSVGVPCAGSDTRPPMLDRTDFESWQQRIRLYCLGKDNGVNILKSIDKGPFKIGKFRETLAQGIEGELHLGPERDRVFADHTPEEKERFKADIRAMNILLQGSPKDIYILINHYTDAKDIWDNVKMLLECSELTKDEHESQLYDEFEHFHQNKGEIIHEYYVKFTKLINDMRNIKMIMPKMQLNSKFVNNMLLNGQHEAHANENKMIMERYNQHAIDPLALVSNVSPHQVDRTEVRRIYARGSVAVRNKGVQNRNGAVLDEEQLLFIAGGQTNTFDDDEDKAPV
ncbi:hypothetical protein Tco_0949101 [Tanacetum coccineum]